jgi:hypothetical protein
MIGRDALDVPALWPASALARLERCWPEAAVDVGGDGGGPGLRPLSGGAVVTGAGAVDSSAPATVRVGVNLGATSWTPSEGMTLDEWMLAGRALVTAYKLTPFLLGDWLNAGRRAFGAKYLAGEALTGLERSTLKNLASVASRVPADVRRRELSWSHHRWIAPLPRDAQVAWLAEAVAKGWTSQHLDLALKGRQRHLDHLAAVAGDYSGGPQVMPSDPPPLLRTYRLTVAATVELPPCDDAVVWADAVVHSLRKRGAVDIDANLERLDANGGAA